MKKITGSLIVLLVLSGIVMSQHKPRARDLGISFDGTPGRLNAITDVTGVEVGQTTLISGDGALKVGMGPVRTGVTGVLPRGKNSTQPVFAAWFSLNGNGEMTGTTWIEESGFLEGPLMITNTHSVGVVRDAVIAWQVQTKRRPPLNSFGEDFWSLPLVAETYDGFLNDINGFHVKQQHVFDALNNAGSTTVAEGNVGGGTGMICYGFKGGIGTASRKLSEELGGYTVAALVQCNCGRRGQLMVAGVPVGREISEDLPTARANDVMTGDTGSIIIVIATDAPLLPHQLKRLARRASMGLARTGSTSGNGSGDIFVAFSTANAEALRLPTTQVTMLGNNRINPVFDATVQVVEEAIINSMVAAETMTGINNRKVIALPHDRLRRMMQDYRPPVERRAR
ncbi:MAG: P1 family peptidase [Pyrinomonadaceae bacterium]|nr:P1 family peptidase [Pyrinomonadaceae bacterium]